MNNELRGGFTMAETCMSESEVENFVDNFKGMLWDELEDALNCMSPEDMVAVILALKKRFG
ncbi:MAG: Uncharacterized protein XD90_1989 [Methanobacterium sp. 42_16]|nr:MAG: Uncharacterized protein XD90_1989 [Methanobacterium sp. 42_16]